jgi:hypothetical protein
MISRVDVPGVSQGVPLVQTFIVLLIELPETNLAFDRTRNVERQIGVAL